MDRIFRKVERIAQRDRAGGQFDLVRKSLFGAGGKDDGAVSSNAQLHVTEKTGVVMEEADVGRPGRADITRDRRREKRLAVDESEIVDLTGLDALERNARLAVRRRNLNEFVGRH